jgi:DNA (cytosine-5)-methyltransferase 1
MIDRAGMTHFSLFSGIGGLDLAAEWAGFRTVGQCEWADYPTKVLEKHWPDVPRWRDVREVTGEKIRDRGISAITVLSGGDPCQPHSLASASRKGTSDPRYLWPEYFRIVQETNPYWVVNENVIGSISNGVVLKKITDLESIGYECQAFAVPALAVGAWHTRERVIIVANSNCIRLQRRKKSRNIIESRPDRPKQFEGFYKAYPRDTNGKPESQKDKKINPIREKWNAWKDIARELGGTVPRNYWTLSEPPIPGVDDGIPNRMERSHTLGNAVVPQQAYPVFQAIADIERSTYEST